MNVINYIEENIEYDLNKLKEVSLKNYYYCFYNVCSFKQNIYLKYLFDENDKQYNFFGGNYISYNTMCSEGDKYIDIVKNSLDVENIEYIGYYLFEKDVFILYNITDVIKTNIYSYTFGTAYDILNTQKIFNLPINKKIINLFKNNTFLYFLSSANEDKLYKVPITFYKNNFSNELHFTKIFGPKREREKKYIKLNQIYIPDHGYNCRFLIFNNNISTENEVNTEIHFNAEKNISYVYISGINILYCDNIYI